MPAEASAINFIDGTRVVLWTDTYRNYADLRVILDRANNLLQGNKQFGRLNLDIERKSKRSQSVAENDRETFNGHHLLSLNGLLFYGWLVFIAIMAVSEFGIFLSNYGAIAALFISTIIVAAMITHQMHYFIVTGNCLIVKNSIWVWRRHIYSLSEISEVAIESPPKLSTALRVIPKDFRDKLYPAGSLREKTWKKLIERLSSHGVKVRNEAI